MKLIFGGAYQGKLDYALEICGLNCINDGADIHKCSAESTDMPENKKIIYEIDKWILALIQAGFDGERLADRLAAFKERFAGTDSVIICNDISCGVVPTDYKLRMWRETVGRTLADLAKMADEAVRLFCGIPTKIK